MYIQREKERGRIWAYGAGTLLTQVTPCPSCFWRGPQFTGLNFTTDFKNTCIKRLSWAPFLPSLQQRPGFSLSSPAPVKTRAKVTLGSKWNPWGIILLLPSDHSEPRTPPYTTLGPPLLLGFQRTQQLPTGPDSWQSLPHTFSFLLCSWHLACPAHFHSWFDHLFYQSPLAQECVPAQITLPQALSTCHPRELGTTPTHWTTISLYSLSPLVHSGPACLGTCQSPLQLLSWLACVLSDQVCQATGA